MTVYVWCSKCKNYYLMEVKSGVGKCPQCKSEVTLDE